MFNIFESSQTKISNLMYFCILTISSFSIEFVIFPWVIAVLEGAQFLFIIGLSFLLRLLLWWWLGSTLQKYPGHTLSEIISLNYGKAVGNVVAFIQTIYLFFIQILLLLGTMKLVKSFLIVNTPVYIILLFICCLSVYGVLKGISGIARMSKGILLLMPILLIFFIISIPKIDVTNFFPLYEGDLLGILYAAYLIFSVYSGVEVASIYSRYLRDSNKIVNVGMYSICVTHLVYLVSCLSTFGVLGSELILHHRWSLLSVAAMLHSVIVNRPEIIFCFLLLAILFMTLNIYGFANLATIVQSVNIKKSKLNVIVIAGYYVLMFFCTWYVSKGQTILDLMYFKQYYPIGLMIVLVLCLFKPKLKDRKVE